MAPLVGGPGLRITTTEEDIVKRSSLVFSSLMMLTLGAAFVACGEGDDPLADAGTGGSSAGSGGSGGGGSGGSGGSGGTGGGSSDAGGDTGGSASAYTWIAIVDDDKAPACSGSGPGADIDSVDLIRGATPMTAGVGKVGSATLMPQTGATACTMCNNAACAYSSMASVAEGLPNGKVAATGSDMGYVSLNSQVLWLQFGGANGMAAAQQIMSGDSVKVNEIDLAFKALGTDYAPANCACPPEKYTVWAYKTMGDTTTRVQLMPTEFEPENMATCGASPTGMVGCGTTTFKVP
jgi:hypothetical protein